jgi:LmbE family N-acetylglucosaminyl deacetylase
MTDAKLRVLVIGAHPDDCDFTAGGVAALYARQGHTVKFVSVTNGDAGHHLSGGGRLAQRRKAEAAAAGAVIGIEYQVLDNHDGQLMPTLENRAQIIGLIREFKPDLVMSPRPNDYHPDHRYTAQLIQDAAYMVTVPNVNAFNEHLAKDPVIVYVSDTFQKPAPFTPDVVVAIDDVVDRKLDMFHAHTSQFYEWLPYNGGFADQVPAEDTQRRAWLAQHYGPRLRRDAERFRSKLIELYGAEIGRRVQHAEAFEGCEYGARLTPDNMRRLFPFFPSS